MLLAFVVLIGIGGEELLRLAGLLHGSIGHEGIGGEAAGVGLVVALIAAGLGLRRLARRARR
jgi:hypothetical protein